MAKVLVTEQYLDNIADAIREKNGSSETYTPAQMAGAINTLYPEPSGSISITQNGTVDVKSKANANVNVPNSYVAADEGKVVSSGALVEQTSRNVTMNGTYDTTENNEVVVNVSGGGGGSYPVADAFLNGRLSTILNFGNYAYGSYLQTDSQYVKKFLNHYARDIFGSTKGTPIKYGVIAQVVAITSSDLQGTLEAFVAKFPVLSSAEYYGYVYNQTQILSDIGAVLLGDFSSGGEATGNALSDSIDNYSAVLLQGIYNKYRTSQYNTSMIYVLPELNTAYWTGMKDRNSSYDCVVTFTDDSTVSLSDNKQVIIYGIP